MATFQERVEAYVGPFTDTDSLDVWLTEEALALLPRFPDDELRVHAAFTNVPPTGLPVDSLRPLGFMRDGRQCYSLPAELLERVNITSSFHYATSEAPAVVLFGANAYIYPAGGAVNVCINIPHPTVLHSQTQIINFPVRGVGLVVLGTAVKAKTQQINDLRTTSWPTAPSITDLTFDLEAEYLKITTTPGWLDVEEDLEMVEGELKVMTMKMNEFSVALQSYVSQVQTQVHKLTIEKLALDSLRALYADQMALQFGVGQKGNSNEPS